MNGDLLALALTLALLFVVVTAIAAVMKQKRRRPLDTEYFMVQWKEAQKLCAKKDTWPLAVINADKLLDEALKRTHYRGKTMGERLVAAQRDLSDNDAVWYGHKLRNRLVHEHDVRLKQADVVDALSGIRQALRDLGALKK